jgi:YidC/Oxa1 family membrane protein insertase
MSQRPDDQKNLIIAVVLSIAVMLGWQFFYAGPQMKAQQERAQREKLEAQKAAEAAGQTTPQAPAVPGAPPTTTAPTHTAPITPAATRDEALGRGARIQIDTPSLRGSISLKGGLIDDVVLKNYRETVDPKSPNVVLFSPPG